MTELANNLRKSKNYQYFFKGIDYEYKCFKNWEDVLTSKYFDIDNSCCMMAFVDYVEQQYKQPINSIITLQNLTSINKCLQVLNRLNDTKKYQLDNILNSSRYHLYYNFLIEALKNNYTFDQLNEIDTKQFHLFAKWRYFRSKPYSKKTAILYAIGNYYNLHLGIVNRKEKFSEIAKKLCTNISTIKKAYYQVNSI